MPRQTKLSIVPDSPMPGVEPTGFYQIPNWAAIKAIRAKLTSADWCVWSYLQMLDPFGDRLIETPTPEQIAAAVGLSEKQVKRSMHKLEEMELWEFKITAMKGRNLAVPQKDKVVPKKTKLSESGQSCPSLDKVVPKKTKLSESGQSCPKQEPEPALLEASNSPHTSSYSYQKFINTLSEEERENFLNFCRATIRHYKNPVVNLDDYLASVDATGCERWIDLSKRWERFKATAQTTALNPGLKGVDEKVINSVDPRIQLIERLKQDWGRKQYDALVRAVADGWVYFVKVDDPFPLEQALSLTSEELKAIAQGEQYNG